MTNTPNPNENGASQEAFDAKRKVVNLHNQTAEYLEAAAKHFSSAATYHENDNLKEANLSVITAKTFIEKAGELQGSSKLPNAMPN